MRLSYGGFFLIILSSFFLIVACGRANQSPAASDLRGSLSQSSPTAIASPSASQTAITATATAPPTPITMDCSWMAGGKAWIDANANGLWDSAEQPLENVVFRVDDVLNGYEDVGAMAISDATGQAQIYVWLPGCPETAFVISAHPPERYEPVTPERVEASEQAADQEFVFGFRYPLDAPTATPRPSVMLQCTSYPLPAGGPLDTFATDMAVTSDGTVWVSTNNGAVLRYDPPQYQEMRYTFVHGLPNTVIRSIELGADGAVWVGTNQGAAHLQEDGSWKTYTTQDGLADTHVDDIAIDADGTVWFATGRGVSSFRPQTGVWITQAIDSTQLTSGWNIDTIGTAPDGSLWFLSNTAAYQRPVLEGSNAQREWIVHKRGPEHSFGGLYRLQQGAAVFSDDLWLLGASQHGPSLLRIDGRTQELTLYNHRTTGGAMVGGAISSVALAPDSTLWLGMVEGGILQFFPDEEDLPGQWLHYTVEEGLSHNAITAIVVAADGAVWVGYNASEYDGPQAVARCLPQKE